MYIPPNSVSSGTIEQPQIRLLLIGPPKFGKTWSALTFPNPIVVDFDNGLTAPELRAKNVPVLPFYNTEWLNKAYPSKKPVNALSDFMFKEAPQLGPDQTLIFDSLSTISDALGAMLTSIQPKGKDGQPDGFWYWKEWAIWFQNFCVRLTTLKCQVVLISHEQEIRDADTNRVIAYRWLLKGQDFSHRLPQFFTDVFRQTMVPIQKTIPGTPPQKVVEKEYKWQINPTPLFPYCATRMSTENEFVPATYESFKY